jgi:PAS domain-containing protein
MLEAMLECGLARKLLDVLMDSTPSCTVVVAAPDARVLKVSAYGERIFGHPRDRIEGRPLAEVVEKLQPTDARGRRLSVDELPLARALRGETIVGFKGALPTGSGAVALIASNAAPICDPNGVVIGAVSVLSDMTLFEGLIADLVRERGARSAAAGVSAPTSGQGSKPVS